MQQLLLIILLWFASSVGSKAQTHFKNIMCNILSVNLQSSKSFFSPQRLSGLNMYPDKEPQSLGMLLLPCRCHSVTQKVPPLLCFVLLTHRHAVSFSQVTAETLFQSLAVFTAAQRLSEECLSFSSHHLFLAPNFHPSCLVRQICYT